MAGYGNRTAPDYTAEDLQDQHSTTRLGLVDSHTPYHNPHEKHGSGITGGAGFGNPTLPLPSCHCSSANAPLRTDLTFLTPPQETNAPRRLPTPTPLNSVSAATPTQRLIPTGQPWAADLQAAQGMATRRGR